MMHCLLKHHYPILWKRMGPTIQSPVKGPISSSCVKMKPLWASHLPETLPSLRQRHWCSDAQIFFFLFLFIVICQFKTRSYLTWEKLDLCTLLPQPPCEWNCLFITQLNFFICFMVLGSVQSLRFPKFPIHKQRLQFL